MVFLQETRRGCGFHEQLTVQTANAALWVDAGPGSWAALVCWNPFLAIGLDYGHDISIRVLLLTEKYMHLSPGGTNYVPCAPENISSSE